MISLRKQKEITGHAGAIYTCVADQSFIYTGSADKYVARWKIDEGVQDKFAIRFEQSVYALELINSDKLAVGLSNGGLHLFDLNNRVELKYLVQHQKGIFSIHQNAVNKQVYVGDANGNLSIWDEEFNLLIYLPLNCGKIRSIDSSNDGEYFAVAGQDGTVRIFDTKHFNELHTLNAHKDGSTSVLFHPMYPDQLISGGKDAHLRLWNWKEEELLRTVVAHTFAIYDIQAINNGKHLVTASRDKNVKLWEAESIEFVKRLDFKEGGHRHSVNALSKMNEHEIASCSDDKRIIIWEIE